MAFRKLYDPANGQMRVAGLMSGSGSNLRKIIEHERNLESSKGRAPYSVVVIFSENPKSNAIRIGDAFGIPVVTRDLGAFYETKGKPRKDLSVRAEFDEGTVDALKKFEVTVAAYAGYMSIATNPLINAFLGINVHPADLSIMDEGRRKYTGDKAVKKAILAGETWIRSSTHIIESQVDYGRILMISPQLRVILPDGFNPDNAEQLKVESEKNQDRLKEIGDWIIFPKTLEHLANGRYSQDENCLLYFDNKPISFGLKLEN